MTGESESQCSLGGFACEPTQNLRHPGPTDPKVTGECRPVLELASIEKCLIVQSKFERIALFFRFGFRLRFGRFQAIPRVK